MEDYLRKDVSVYGIDISEIAVNKANSEGKGKYLCADIVSYSADKKIDLILFYEVLYYVKNPLGVLKRYLQFLTADGRILCSVYHPFEENEAYFLFENLIKCILETHSCSGFDVIMQNTVLSGGIHWKIIVLGPLDFVNK